MLGFSPIASNPIAGENLSAAVTIDLALANTSQTSSATTFTITQDVSLVIAGSNQVSNSSTAIVQQVHNLAVDCCSNNALSEVGNVTVSITLSVTTTNQTNETSSVVIGLGGKAIVIGLVDVIILSQPFEVIMNGKTLTR